MTSRSESRSKRLLIAFAFFVLLPAAYQFAIFAFGIDSKSYTKTEPVIVATQSPSPTPTNLTCFEIRQERQRIEASSNSESKQKLNDIYTNQREILLTQLETLHAKNLIEESQWSDFQDLLTLVQSSDIPLSPFVDEYVRVDKVLASLLNKRLIKPYFDDRVVSLGNELAETKNPELVYILENSECFDVWEIDLAKSITNLEVKSAWGAKKTSKDFMEVLTYKTR